MARKKQSLDAAGDSQDASNSRDTSSSDRELDNAELKGYKHSRVQTTSRKSVKRTHSEVYLVMHKEKHGNPTVKFSIVHSLDDAKKVPVPTPTEEDEPSAPQPKSADTPPSPFLNLVRETSREIEVFRSFYGLIGFILKSSSLIQYKTRMEPVLKNTLTW